MKSEEAITRKLGVAVLTPGLAVGFAEKFWPLLWTSRWPSVHLKRADLQRALTGAANGMGMGANFEFVLP